MTTHIEAYTPLDWSLLITAILKKLGATQVQITLEDLNAILAGDDILKLEENPQAQLMEIAIVTRMEAEALRFKGAEMYGSLKKPTKS